MREVLTNSINGESTIEEVIENIKKEVQQAFEHLTDADVAHMEAGDHSALTSYPSYKNASLQMAAIARDLEEAKTADELKERIRKMTKTNYAGSKSSNPTLLNPRSLKVLKEYLED